MVANAVNFPPVQVNQPPVRGAQPLKGEINTLRKLTKTREVPAPECNLRQAGVHKMRRTSPQYGNIGGDEFFKYCGMGLPGGRIRLPAPTKQIDEFATGGTAQTVPGDFAGSGRFSRSEHRH